jgi:two-component system sensor histidine kinase KdpD
LVDELAHTNIPGSKHLKRYQDALDLREYGINVISTVNIQHMASLQDTVRLLAGVTVSETLPDWVLDAADDLEMVDLAPDALRKRLQRGNIQPREQVDRALDSFFRTETLTALRELTLRRMALHTERKVQDGAELDGLPASAATSDETVLVCVLRSDEAQVLVRRGVHLAERLRARLIVLSIGEPGGGLYSETRGHQETMKALQLARALGAEVHSEVASSSVSETLVRFAQAAGASQIVLGESTSSWLNELFGGSMVRDVLRRTQDVDVHIVRRAER